MKEYEVKLTVTIFVIGFVCLWLGYSIGVGEADIKCREGVKSLYVEHP